MTTEIDCINHTPPTRGWLVDLTESQRQSLVGAHVDISCNARATNGLVMDIVDGIVRIFRDDRPEPLEFAVAGSNYVRVPGTPMRPALAHALVYQRTWEARRDALTDDDGEALNQHDYDTALGNYEEGLRDVYDALIREYSAVIFRSPVPGQGGNV